MSLGGRAVRAARAAGEGGDVVYDLRVNERHWRQKPANGRGNGFIFEVLRG